ncbi:hypothetical protein [Polaribacter ponticola]|uniref:Tetratricopeptide repeat protein n=1 Tax=Polaribacter ponticola TaxID=2978475 RepID=A0ABT5S793_9FLAO|nr:hypothetical protein [Polaribacter sp. MSW5]MDD7913938.1 hypothetical protein [Polaribacter sp. MSW5]
MAKLITKKELFYIKLYLKEAYNGIDKNRIGYALNLLGIYYEKNNEYENALINFKKALNYMDRTITRNTIFQNISSIYLNFYNNIDSALFYNKKAINGQTSKKTLAFIHKDLAIINKRKYNFIEENKNLKIALENIKQDPFKELEVDLYKFLSENNKALKNYKTSLYYLEKYDSLNEVVKNQSLIEKVEEIETKYQTEKRERKFTVKTR